MEGMCKQGHNYFLFSGLVVWKEFCTLSITLVIKSIMDILSVSGKVGWYGINIRNNTLPCHLLMYLYLHVSPSNQLSQNGSVIMPGLYALVHSVAENDFQNVPTIPLYTAKNKDCWLIRV